MHYIFGARGVLFCLCVCFMVGLFCWFVFLFYHLMLYCIVCNVLSLLWLYLICSWLNSTYVLH